MLKFLKGKNIYLFAVIGVTALIGVLFYILNYYTPFYADDYWYSFSFSTGERIESVHQIIDSQIAHYQDINGRSVTHVLAQLFLLIGDNAFNFINVFFFLSLLYVIYFHSCGSFKNFSLSKFSMIAMLLFLCCPAFGQSFLWITGAANYLYGILIILCFMIPYRLQLDSETSKYPIVWEIISAIVYFVFGIIAGWTNENTSVAMIVMIVAYIIFYCMKSIRLHAWNFTGCLGGIIGCLLVLLSPGTANRLEKSGGSGSIITWIKRIFFYSIDIVLLLKLAIILFVVLITLYLYQKRDKIKNQFWKEAFSIVKESSVTLIYLIGFLASVYSMIVSPRFPGRVWSGPVILLLVSLISLSCSVNMSSISSKIGKIVALGCVLCICMTTYVDGFFDVRNVYSFYEKRVATIESSIADGKTSVEVPNIKGDTGYSCFVPPGDLKLDIENGFPNVEIAKYYGLDEVICSD